MPNEEIRALEKTLEKLRSEPPDSNLVFVLNKLAYALMHTDPRKAEDFALEAADLAHKQGLHIEHAKACTTLGTTNCREELDKAREYFGKALEIRMDFRDKKGIASTLGNIGSLYKDYGDNESALDFFIKSLELFEELGNGRGISFTSSCIGGIYTAKGRFDEAEELISKGLEISRELKFKDREIHCLESIIDLYRAKGDLEKALMYSRELRTCLEEHMNDKSMEKIAGLQVQFETEKKEKEAEIYRLKNVELSRINNELRNALADMKKLQGMLPICSNCKKIRDDEGYWQQIESYICEHSDAQITHGICPECFIKLYSKDSIR